MKKLLSTLLASAVALTAMGALAACNPDNNGGTKAGQLSDYYLVGESAGDLFAGTKVEGWVPIGNKDDDGNIKGAASRSELPEKLFFRTTNKADVYTITVDLYKNDKWCICDATAGEAAAADETGSLTGWENQIKFSKGGIDHGVEDEYMVKSSVDFGDEQNFVVKTGGKYEITYDVHGVDADDIEVGTVTWKRIDDAKKIEMAEQDIYIKGNLESLNGWAHDFSEDWKLDYDADKGEYTFTVVVGEDDLDGTKSFGFAQYEKGASTGDGNFMNAGFVEGGTAKDVFGHSGNFTPTAVGTYKLTVKFNGAWEVYVDSVEA